MHNSLSNFIRLNWLRTSGLSLTEKFSRHDLKENYYDKLETQLIVKTGFFIVSSWEVHHNSCEKRRIIISEIKLREKMKTSLKIIIKHPAGLRQAYTRALRPYSFKRQKNFRVISKYETLLIKATLPTQRAFLVS
jgi:hypothetical protein